MNEITKKAEEAFRVYIEAVLRVLHPHDILDREALEFSNRQFLDFLEKRMDVPEKEIGEFRRTLAESFFDLRRKKKELCWDTNITVRDAIIRFLNLASYDEYLIATRMKKNRSIDDPWETS